tara:strand:- start:35 stop:256 length:222 start_codon:yes stop_codon:yes gene_type:complete
MYSSQGDNPNNIENIMSNEAKKYQVLDDSNGSNHGKQIFQSDNREEASSFYNEYENQGNNVALLQRNPEWKAV